MLFYLIFAVLDCFSRAAGILVVGIWAGLVVMGAVSTPNDLYLGFIESPYHIEFALGAFAAYMAVRHPARYAAAFALLGIAAFLFCRLSAGKRAVNRIPDFGPGKCTVRHPCSSRLRFGGVGEAGVKL